MGKMYKKYFRYLLKNFVFVFLDKFTTQNSDGQSPEITVKATTELTFGLKNCEYTWHHCSCETP